MIGVYALLLVGVTLAWGQATSQINGIIRHASGAAVPGTDVRAKQTNTGIVRTVTSDANGSYVLRNLPIGPYTVEASKDGFSKFIQSGIVLQVDSLLFHRALRDLDDCHCHMRMSY